MKAYQTKPLATLFFLLGILYTSLAQSQNPVKLDYPEQLNFKKVRITTKTWEEIKSPTLELYPSTNTLDYINPLNQKKLNLGLENIHTIEYQKGSKALIWGLVGAGTGILVFSAINEANNWGDPFNDVSSSTIGATFFACTGLGFSIGALIGSKSKKYKKIYVNNQFVK